jgi:hypothetical protein
MTQISTPEISINKQLKEDEAGTLRERPLKIRGKSAGPRAIPITTQVFPFLVCHTARTLEH